MNGPSERIFWVGLILSDRARARVLISHTYQLLAEPGNIPKHAIQAGEDKEGNPTFVSRNFHEVREILLKAQ